MMRKYCTRYPAFFLSTLFSSLKDCLKRLLAENDNEGKCSIWCWACVMGYSEKWERRSSYEAAPVRGSRK